MCPGVPRAASGSRHSWEEEPRCLSHARAALASTRLVTGKSQPRSALPSVKWILAAPPLKQSRRSGAMAGALSHGSPASSAPCESAWARAGAGCPRTAHVQPAGQSQESTSPCDPPVVPAQQEGRQGRIQALWAGGRGSDTPPPPQALLTMSTSKTRSRCDPSQMKLWSRCGPSLLSPLPVPILAEVLHSSAGVCHPPSHVQQPPPRLGTPHSPACSMLSPLSCDMEARRGDVTGPGL